MKLFRFGGILFHNHFDLQEDFWNYNEHLGMLKLFFFY